MGKWRGIALILLFVFVCWAAVYGIVSLIQDAIALLPRNEPEPIARSEAIQEVIEAQKELNEALKALLEAERAQGIDWRAE